MRKNDDRPPMVRTQQRQFRKVVRDVVYIVETASHRPDTRILLHLRAGTTERSVLAALYRTLADLSS
ncbi:MAG: hypothetical protein E6Q97_07375 [Desulfurellales bacterium]|nr:MAG: hypothetical protein E6Q97_07375 [Desulfurellales bacterium]